MTKLEEKANIVKRDRQESWRTGGEQPSRLRFDSQDDALNFARKSVEDGNSWLASNNINCAKGYIEGKLQIVIQCSSSHDSGKYELIIMRVPDWHRDGTAAQGHAVNGHAGGSVRQGDEHLVFVRCRELADGIEQIIPSFVGLEPTYKHHDFRRDTFASSFNASFNFGGIISEGKINTLEISDAKAFGAGADGMIERRSKVIDSIGSTDFKLAGQPASEFELVRLLSGIRIRVYDGGVWLGIEDGLALPFQIRNVFPSAVD